MTPEEALRILDNATSQLACNRADHMRIITALQTIDAALAGLRGLEAEAKSDAKPEKA